MWTKDVFISRLDGRVEEISYGHTHLETLRTGDRLGLRISSAGDLEFFVNGESQGVAVKRVYEKGYDVYAVVDHYANCRATCVSKAGSYVIQ